MFSSQINVLPIVSQERTGYAVTKNKPFKSQYLINKNNFLFLAQFTNPGRSLKVGPCLVSNSVPLGVRGAILISAFETAESEKGNQTKHSPSVSKLTVSAQKWLLSILPSFNWQCKSQSMLTSKGRQRYAMKNAQ